MKCIIKLDKDNNAKKIKILSDNYLILLMALQRARKRFTMCRVFISTLALFATVMFISFATIPSGAKIFSPFVMLVPALMTTIFVSTIVFPAKSTAPFTKPEALFKYYFAAIAAFVLAVLFIFTSNEWMRVISYSFSLTTITLALLDVIGNDSFLCSCCGLTCLYRGVEKCQRLSGGELPRGFTDSALDTVKTPEDFYRLVVNDDKYATVLEEYKCSPEPQIAKLCDIMESSNTLQTMTLSTVSCEQVFVVIRYENYSGIKSLKIPMKVKLVSDKPMLDCLVINFDEGCVTFHYSQIKELELESFILNKTVGGLDAVSESEYWRYNHNVS